MSGLGALLHIHHYVHIDYRVNATHYGASACYIHVAVLNTTVYTCSCTENISHSMYVGIVVLVGRVVDIDNCRR